MRPNRRVPLQVLVTATPLILALTGCAGSGGPPPHAHRAAAGTPHEPDTRQQVSLTPGQREAVLAEMRMMLGSVSGVLHGLAANDHQAIEKAARAAGMRQAVDPTLAQTLPKPFLELGMATHTKFDALAALARAGAPGDQLTRSLADVTTSCVACHAMYRF